MAELSRRNVPVVVDSPLAMAATEVFRLHPECFDEETSKLLESALTGQRSEFVLGRGTASTGNRRTHGDVGCSKQRGGVGAKSVDNVLTWSRQYLRGGTEHFEQHGTLN